MTLLLVFSPRTALAASMVLARVPAGARHAGHRLLEAIQRYAAHHARLATVLACSVAVQVIRMMKGPWWEAGLAVALLFSVVMTSPLLIPNPYMPREVRMVHLLETASSNFLFGWIIVLVLCKWRSPGLARQRT
jgi:hypothetical protein